MGSRARVALMLLPAIGVLFSGCITADDLLVALSAPKTASGMTIFLVADKGLLSRFASGNADYVVYFGDKIVYPPLGKGGSFEVSGRSGSTFIPYDRFVVGNGEYDVLVRYAGTETRSRVHVEKWVSYVYLHPFAKDDLVVVESALQSATGGSASDRILAHGELILTVKYRGLDGSSDENVAQFTTQTQNTDVSTQYSIARSRFDHGPGYYSFEPLFHNIEARDNVQVKGDPTMANTAPPFNWIFLK